LRSISIPNMSKNFAFCCILSLAISVAADTDRQSSSLKLSDLKEVPYTPGQPFKTGWYKQELDHFNFNSDQTFFMRFIYDDQYWKADDESVGPVFIYTGNEGPLEGYWDNTGFFTQTLAKELNALVVMIEHRYYGQTLPFGDDSYKVENMVWNNAEQVLVDYAIFLQNLRSANPDQLMKSAFIGFGGSYGGMLVSWLRMKYPHAIDGVLASSAAIRFYIGETDTNAFNKVVTDDYRAVDERCPVLIRRGFAILEELRTRPDTWEDLGEIFNTCDKIQTEEQELNLQSWLLNAYQYIAMGDYPYPANFIAHMPGWPVRVSCQALLDNMPTSFEQFMPMQDDPMNAKNRALLKAMKASVDPYYNYQAKEPRCSETLLEYDFYNVYYYAPTMPKSANLSLFAWNYTACSEEIMPVGSNGVTDMFNARIWDEDKYAEYCKNEMKVNARQNYIRYQYGGTYNKLDFESYSNIIFTNGNLDPWHPGGILSDVNENVYGILIDQAAHHLDLRLPHEEDPESVRQVRARETQIFRQWMVQRKARVEALQGEEKQKPNPKQGVSLAAW